ncbi:ABC transporter substrate-binding protein [Modestobacter versicolor]|uniref:ABC transporter substrate-binding protein n=1 Tax=Modestobacter versicolor TaxID=429133 RepID=UPI0034DE5EDC
MTLPRSRRRSAAALGLAAVLLTAACGGGDDGGSGGGSASGSSLVIAQNEPPATFDPVQADNSTVDEVVLPLYDTLVDYDAANELYNELATDVTVADDGLSIAVTLRDDVTFHDGAPLTATDVAYTLDRVKRLGLGVNSNLTSYDSTDVTSDTELTINLTAPDATMVPALSRVYVLNSALVEENAGDDDGQSWLATHEAGSGPYTLESYTSNQEAVFAQYADYWQGFDGQAEEVVISYLPESGTQRDELRAGDVDIAMDIATADLASFESDDGFVVDKADTLVQLYMYFDMEEGPTTDPRVREALRLAYDYPAHVDSILAGNGEIAQGPLPIAMSCHADIPAGEQDLDRAEQLFAEAGVTQLELHYLSAIEEMDRAAASLQSSLRDIGVTLDLTSVTYPDYAEEAATGATRPDIGVIYAFPAFPDAAALLYPGFATASIGGQNFSGYSNPQVDALLAQAGASTDDAERCDLYTQVQEQIEADMVAINVADPKAVAVMRSGLEDFGYRAAHTSTVDVYSIKVS